MERGAALVTGSSSGFGLRTCVALAAHGFKVYASMRDTSRAASLRGALQHSGFGLDRVEIVELEVTDHEQGRALVDRICEAEGAVDVLVNNAGVMHEGFAEELDEAGLRAQFEVNFFALVELTRAVLPAMRARRWGRVINLSSASGRHAIPRHAAYCASKFAVEGWSEALRYELVPYNVFVSLVEPGMFPTEIFGRNRRRGELAREDAPGHARLAAGLEQDTQRMQRLMSWADPDDVARVIAKIAVAESPRLRYPVGVDAWLGALSLKPAVRTWWEQRMIQLFQR